LFLTESRFADGGFGTRNLQSHHADIVPRPVGSKSLAKDSPSSPSEATRICGGWCVEDVHHAVDRRSRPNSCACAESSVPFRQCARGREVSRSAHSPIRTTSDPGGKPRARLRERVCVRVDLALVPPWQFLCGIEILDGVFFEIVMMCRDRSLLTLSSMAARVVDLPLAGGAGHQDQSSRLLASCAPRRAGRA